MGRFHVLIMYFNWFTTAFIMYGLALSWQNLTGGLFLNFIIGTILDFPAKTLAMLLVQNVGRKYPYMVGSTFTGVMFFLTLFMYTGELMPTTVRAAGVGSSSLVS